MYTHVDRHKRALFFREEETEKERRGRSVQIHPHFRAFISIIRDVNKKKKKEKEKEEATDECACIAYILEKYIAGYQ